MRPHSFKCGRASVRYSQTQRSGLASMRPHSFKCGRAFKTFASKEAKLSFNEAALFQVRKDRERPAKPRRLTRFNEAALFQVRKGQLRRSKS